MNVEKSIDAVSGYLQLGMPVEALEELKEIATAVGEDERYLELLLAAQMMDKRWNDAAVSAQRLCKLRPKKKSFFIHAAFCLHETGDTLERAFELDESLKETAREDEDLVGLVLD